MKLKTCLRFIFEAFELLDKNSKSNFILDHIGEFCWASSNYETLKWDIKNELVNKTVKQGETLLE